MLFVVLEIVNLILWFEYCVLKEWSIIICIISPFNFYRYKLKNVPYCWLEYAWEYKLYIDIYRHI